MLTIKNFWDASVGTWRPLKAIPIEFHEFAKSGNSTYYTNDNEDTVCRESDHWGSGIRECNWYLDGHPRNNSFLFSTDFIDLPLKVAIRVISRMTDEEICKDFNMELIRKGYFVTKR